jgi:hypothetical protein
MKSLILAKIAPVVDLYCRETLRRGSGSGTEVLDRALVG